MKGWIRKAESTGRMGQVSQGGLKRLEIARKACWFGALTMLKEWGWQDRFHMWTCVSLAIWEMQNKTIMKYYFATTISL
jgi:hypothetical protein